MDNVDEFTVHLPSNTRFMDSNSASRYTVKLAMSANLSGEWECGLKEMHYPRTWRNVTETVGSMGVIILDPLARGPVSVSVDLPSNHYETNTALVAAIQKVLRNAVARHGNLQNKLRVVYKPTTGKVEFHLPSGVTLSINPILGNILGFDNETDQHVFVRSGVQTPRSAMTVSLVDALYVYSDVVQSSLVGDAMVPLLRIVPVLGKEGEMCHIEYIRPVYFPVAKLSFSTIEIYITDSAGRKIQFNQGKTTIMLHFRRKKALQPRV